MGAAERPDQIGIDDGLPEILVEAVEFGERDRRRGRWGPGIVDQEIEAPQRVDRPRGHRLCVARLGHIARRGDDAVPCRFQPLDLAGAPRIVGEVIERDGRAAPGKGLHRGESDARRAAGDERGLSGQVGGDHGEAFRV
jgi:hypothetical protein